MKDMCYEVRRAEAVGVYYCSTYYKAVRVCGGGTMEDMCYEGCVFITYYKAVRVGDYCFIQSAVIISRIFAPTNS